VVAPSAGPQPVTQRVHRAGGPALRQVSGVEPGSRLTSVAYWIFNYAPQWEAAAKELRFLSQELGPHYDTRLISLNMRDRTLRVRGQEKSFPLPFALLALPLLRWARSAFQINHIFASLTERVLVPRLKGDRTILTVTKDSPALSAIERNLGHLREIRYVVVESEWHRELLRQGGIAEEAIRLIRPGVDVRPYTPAHGPFTVLFATSPLSGRDLLSRGVFLLVQAAKALPDVRFLLVWRDHALADLKQVIRRAGADNIEIRNGLIPDMGAVYDQVHATALPGLTSASLKPAPHSGLESLAHGKPLLVSRPTSLAPLVRQTGCGVEFEPAVDAFVEAIQRLRDGYPEYQVPCHETARQFFSRTVFLERYRELYASLR
jgi:glycosyltransferase involved in cell wall biosynthesis